jgi:hypothetical protein
VVETLPHVLGSYSLDNMEEHRELLLTKFGISEAKLGQVLYLFSTLIRLLGVNTVLFQ